jgi:hypothetical protein
MGDVVGAVAVGGVAVETERWAAVSGSNVRSSTGRPIRRHEATTWTGF